MAATTLQGVLKKHTEIIAEFKETLGKVERSEPVANDAAVRGKERLLTSIEDRLANAQKAREATIVRLDAGIAGLEKRVETLRAEIENDKEVLKSRGKGGKGGKPRGIPGLDKAPSGRGRVQRAKTSSLTDIKGGGDAYRERPEAAGLHTAADVAKTKPRTLAETLSISESRAKALVSAAKKVKK